MVVVMTDEVVDVAAEVVLMAAMVVVSAVLALPLHQQCSEVLMVARGGTWGHGLQLFWVLAVVLLLLQLPRSCPSTTAHQGINCTNPQTQPHPLPPHIT